MIQSGGYLSTRTHCMTQVRRKLPDTDSPSKAKGHTSQASKKMCHVRRRGVAVAGVFWRRQEKPSNQHRLQFLCLCVCVSSFSGLDMKGEDVWCFR